MDTLKITYPVEAGEPGIDDDPKHPISRALQTLMGPKNSRLPAFAQAILVDDTIGEPARWFGVFVKSDGGRIIFFPGLHEPTIAIRGSKGKKFKFFRKFGFDHISLEKDRASWHVTSERSKDHQHATAPKNLGDGRLLWFGLNLASLDKLRVVRQQTVASFQVSENSAKWKAEEFGRAVAKSSLILIRMPPKPAGVANSFPVISVIVGPPDFEAYQGEEFGWAYGSDMVIGQPPADHPISRMVQRFTLDETTLIQTSAVWAPGRLLLPGILATPIE